MWRKSELLVVFLLLPILGVGCVGTKENMGFKEPMRATQPWKPAMPFEQSTDCLRDDNLRRLVAGESIRIPDIAITKFEEKSGKLNINGDGVGHFLTQDPSTSLRMVLNRVLLTHDRSEDFLKLHRYTYELSKTGLADPPAKISDVRLYLSGAVTTFNPLPGGGIDLSVYGFGFKARGIGAYISAYVEVKDASGAVIAASNLGKIIATTEAAIEVGRVFGQVIAIGGVSVAEREIPDLAVEVITGYLAYDIATQLTGNYTCDEKTNGVFPESRRWIMRQMIRGAQQSAESSEPASAM